MKYERKNTSIRNYIINNMFHITKAMFRLNFEYLDEVDAVKIVPVGRMLRGGRGVPAV